MHPEYVVGRFRLRPAERRVYLDGRPVVVGARAFDLLQVLIEHRDRVVGKDELLARVWPGVVVEEGNLAVQVSALRKLLGGDAIATIPGRGYRFTTPVTELATGGALVMPEADGRRPAVDLEVEPATRLLHDYTQLIEKLSRPASTPAVETSRADIPAGWIPAALTPLVGRARRGWRWRWPKLREPTIEAACGGSNWTGWTMPACWRRPLPRPWA